MHPLYQKLKELDPHTFEIFCFHLLKERHPGVDIRHVEGKGGDEGIDFFLGELDIGPVVWQSKAFPDGIRQVQKKQIRASLSSAIRTSSPRRWLLCTNVDLTAKAHRWYQTLARQYAHTTELGLMQASDIVPQLAHYRTLCNEFFPGARLEVDDIRGLVAGTKGLTESELATVANETVDQLIVRLKERDARFNYEVSFARDVPPDARPSRIGEVFSFTQGTTTVRGIARDLEALRTAPPIVRLSLRGPASRQVQEFLDTGRAQSIAAGQIASITTDLPLEELLEEVPATLTVEVSQKLRDSIAARVTFGKAPTSVIYEYVQFRVARAGRLEMELVSTGPLPFTMNVVIRQHEAAINLTVTSEFTGAEIREIRKFMDAVAALESSGVFECYNLGTHRILFRARAGHLEISDPLWSPEIERLVRDAAEIGDTFSVDLRMPERITERDIDSLIALNGLVTGTPIAMQAITLRILKTPNSIESFDATLLKGIADVQCRFELASFFLFGAPVPVGAITLKVDRAPVKDAAATRERWLGAKIGDSIDLVLGPVDAAEWRKQANSE